jgi:hypothetical protein
VRSLRGAPADAGTVRDGLDPSRKFVVVQALPVLTAPTQRTVYRHDVTCMHTEFTTVLTAPAGTRPS